MSSLEKDNVSWLMMERYALGELGESQRREVERCLARSESARARLKEILEDSSPLPELPALVPLATTRPHRSRVWLRWGSALAAAALVALAFVSAREVESSPERAQIKGGELTISLVSESGVREPETFAQGERFKVLVTRAPGRRESLHLLVFQAGARFEPLAPARIEGGNLVPWPGAFALDGDAPAEICVTWGAEFRSARRGAELGERAACKTLTPR